MSTTHKLTLEVHKRTSRVPQQVVVRQGETATQTIEAEILNDGAAYASSCSSARLDILRADRRWSRVTAAKSGSKVTCTLPSAALSSPGLCRLAHFVFYTGTSSVETTEGFELRILPAVDASDPDGAAKDYDDQLTALWERWSAYEAAAERAEAERVTAESTRKSQEAARASAEQGRAAAETARAEAESSRAAEHASLKAGAQQATAAANGAAARADAAAANCWDIANQVAQGGAGDSDVAALRAQNAAMGSMIADLRDEFYYLDGVVYAPSSKASMSGQAVTLSGACTASGTTINLA